MKVMLSTTPINKNDAWLRGREIVARPSTGMLYLGSMLGKQPGFGFGRVADVCLEEANLGKERTTERIRAVGPDVFGFTCYEFNLQQAKELCDLVRSISPGTLIALGGPAPTKIPRYVLRATGADIVFRGEADFTFRRVIAHLEKGGRVQDIDEAGVLVRDGNGIIETASSEKIPYLTAREYQQIEPDMGLLCELSLRANQQQMDFSFSRGCPYERCSFCQISPVDGHRRLKLETTVRILRDIHAIPGIQAMAFGDGTFGGGQTGAKKLLRAIEQEGLFFPIGYFAEVSVDMLLKQGEMGKREVDDELLALMQAVGMRGFDLGMESFSESQLRKFNKSRYTFEEIKRVLKKAEEFELPGVGGGIFLWGFDSSCEEVIECIERIFLLMQELRHPKLFINDFPTPYAGTGEYMKFLRLREDGKSGLIKMYTARRLLEMFGRIKETGEKDYPYIINAALPFEDFILQRAIIEISMLDQMTQQIFGQDNGISEAGLITRLIAIKRAAQRESDERGCAIVRKVDGIFDFVRRELAFAGIYIGIVENLAKKIEAYWA